MSVIAVQKIYIIIQIIYFHSSQCGNYGVGGGYSGSHMDRNKHLKHDSKIGSPRSPGDRLVTVINVLEAPKAGIYFLTVAFEPSNFECLSSLIKYI